MDQQISTSKTKVVCPICQANKFIEIPGYIFNQKSVDVVKIQVHNPSVCQHDFVIFVDQNRTVRGYELLEINLKYATISNNPAQTAQSLFIEDILENFGNYALLNIFHGLLFNYPIYIILNPSDPSTFGRQLNDLFVRVFPSEIPIIFPMQIINRAEYLKLNVKNAEDLILDTHGLILNCPWRDWKKLDFENAIAQKSLQIIDSHVQTALIQEEIGKIKAWVDLTLQHAENEPVLYENRLKQLLFEKFGIKAANYHVDLIKLFIERRMPEKVALLSKIRNKSFDTLKAGFW